MSFDWERFQQDGAIGTVLTGSTVLAEQHFEQLRGKRIGFVGNHTSRLNDGTQTFLAIQKSGKAVVSKLFAPEHGAFGRLDSDVPDDIEPETSLPILSLYGANRRPPAAALQGLDALVFEIQDVGARFYTYFATLCLCIEAASEAGIPLYVLDRPNPVTGTIFGGPISDTISFTAPHPVPIRHGMTLGELGLLFAEEKGYRSTVHVIPCAGWKRRQWFDETGLSWINPSPAMRSLAAACLYTGVCLLEQTNVSVGRGTDVPFERVGAPFINGHEWMRSVQHDGIPGVSIFARSFIPQASKHAGVECGGLRLVVSDRNILDSVRLGIVLVTTMRDLCGSRFELSGIQTLLANKTVYEAVEGGATTDDICALWSDETLAWAERRRPFLLYED